MTPQIGDHVGLRGTNIVGDVQRVDISCDRNQVSFRVTSVLGTSRNSKAARALRGAWITCLAEVLVSRMKESPGGNVETSTLDAALRAHVERLASEFKSRYSREQIERSVQDSAVRYKDARVTAFVPILVYRDARSALSGS